MGALPSLFAATSPDLSGDSFVGPGGFMGMRGYPTLVDRSAAAKQSADAQRLWSASESLTGIAWR